MKRAFAVILAVVVCLFLRAQAKRHSLTLTTAPLLAETPGSVPNPHAGYVGDDACRFCHADQFASYHQTAHYLTSMASGHSAILGKFTPGDNILKTANPNLFFRMDEQHADGKEDNFLQTAVAGTPPHTNSRSERIAFVIGSGEKGQTYLYWSDDQLFQLPVSYWTRLGWVNSPGYRDGFATLIALSFLGAWNVTPVILRRSRRRRTSTAPLATRLASGAKNVMVRAENTSNKRQPNPWHLLPWQY